MPAIQIDISDLQHHIDVFTNVFSGQQRTELMQVVGRRIGAAAESVVSEYPKPSRKKLPKVYTRDTVAGKKVTPFRSKFKSDKQAYYVTQVLGKGGRIPYSRTGTLAKSITSFVSESSESSVIVSVGTNLKYAKYVIGDEGDQSNYHKGTWMTLSQDLARGADKISEVAHKTFVAEVMKRLG